MGSLEKVITFVRKYREEIEPHWSEDLLYEKFTSSFGSLPSAGYCGPSSVLLWKQLKDEFPDEQFSVAVGRVYEDSSEFVKGKHVWVVWHHKLKGATIIDVTADQSGKINDKVIVEDIDTLARRSMNYVAYQLAKTLGEVNASPKRRAKLLEEKLSRPQL